VSNHACVTVAHHGSVALVSLNRPDVLNAIDADVCDRLVAIFDELESENNARVVLLRGVGTRAFSAGADLTYMRRLQGPALARFIEKTWVCFDRISQSSLPTIAALHGYVLGGGLELALACDLRLADDSVRIALPEMSLGSVPGSGAMQRLPALIGTSKTFELAAFGRRLHAGEALSLGLINALTDDMPLMETAMHWATQLSQRPAEALRYAKVAMRIRGDPAVAAAMHGMVSVTCHEAKGYMHQTDRFNNKNISS